MNLYEHPRLSRCQCRRRLSWTSFALWMLYGLGRDPITRLIAVTCRLRAPPASTSACASFSQPLRHFSSRSLSMAPQLTNRLSDARSMYLLQHASNPVHWQEWGDEALALAKQSERPILASFGYSSCHWCHVMAHEVLGAVLTLSWRCS